MRKLLVLALLFGLVPPSRAFFGPRDKGTAAAQFLKLGAGARGLGMGEALTLASEDAGALYWNPAALTQIPAVNDVLFMHSAYLDTLTHDYGAYARKIGGVVLGVSGQSLSVGDIERKDASGNAEGRFSPYDAAAALAVAGKKDMGGKGTSCAFGLTVKGIASRITRRANTGALDAGFILSLDPGQRVRVGAAVQNLGPGLKYDQRTEPLPTAVKVGAALRPADTWLLALDMASWRDNGTLWALGTEKSFPNRSGWTPRLRFGFNTRAAQDLEGWAGASFGLGVGFRGLSLDYALVPYDDLGTAHHMSLGWGF